MKLFGIDDALQEAADDLQRRAAALKAAFVDASSPDVIATLIEAVNELQEDVERHRRICRDVLLRLSGECGKERVEKL